MDEEARKRYREITSQTVKEANVQVDASIKKAPDKSTVLPPTINVCYNLPDADGSAPVDGEGAAGRHRESRHAHHITQFILTIRSSRHFY